MWLAGCGLSPSDAPEPAEGELTGIAYAGGSDTFPLSLLSSQRPIDDRHVVAIPVDGFERLKAHSDLPADSDASVLGSGRVGVSPDGIEASGSVVAALNEDGHFRLSLASGDYLLCLAAGDPDEELGLRDCVEANIEVPERIGLERVTDELYVRRP